MDGPFSASERSYSDAPRTERHPFLQLVVPVRGRLDMVIAGQHGYAGDTQFARVPPGIEHRFWANQPNRLLILDLSPDLLTAVPGPRAWFTRLSSIPTIIRCSAGAGKSPMSWPRATAGPSRETITPPGST